MRPTGHQGDMAVESVIAESPEPGARAKSVIASSGLTIMPSLSKSSPYHLLTSESIMRFPVIEGGLDNNSLTPGSSRPITE